MTAHSSRSHRTTDTDSTTTDTRGIGRPRTSRRTLLGASGVALSALGLAACNGSGFEDTDTGSSGSDGGSGGSGGSGGLSLIFGSSGDAETTAVQDAVAAWSEESGIDVEVTVATDMVQQLSQGFAAGNPFDVFYLGPDALAGYAGNGSLEPLNGKLDNEDDFYPNLLEAYTVDGNLYGAPKDFSTLALVINDDLWSAAGLGDSDHPTTWDDLKSVAQKLTSGDVVGLTMGAEYQRVGAFMVAAGGELVTDDAATANSAENVEGLTFIQDLQADGCLKFASDLCASWGGEAFGTGKAAMTVEGNWVTGGLAADFPDVSYTVVELPAGPAGQGTLEYTNTWGVAADSADKDTAIELVNFLTTTDQQLAFAKAFGVMPALQSAADAWREEYPELVAFIDSAEYAKDVPSQDGVAEVISDFNAQLEQLATQDPQAVLDGVQSNLEAALG
jgi:multiple sugar transport system substrate-binding protein